jgi:hypothetical protein
LKPCKRIPGSRGKKAGEGPAAFRRGGSPAARAKGPGSFSESRRTYWCVWMGRGMAGESSSAMAQSTAAGVDSDGGAPARNWRRKVAG